MKKPLIYLSILFLFMNLYVHADHPVRHVSQVILWGHPLHSHTHSYIHWGFQRAFQHLGYKTLWIDQRHNLTNIDFSNSLFITEGQVDRGIPILEDCYYIIHNCKTDKYRHLLDNGHAIILQVYTHDCINRGEPAFSPCFHYDLNQPIIYMPWATDLLPHEIDEVKKQISTKKPKQNIATFVGSISQGHFGNKAQVNSFSAACKEHGITFQHGGVNSRTMEENITLVQNALLAPALQGLWQCEKGYIPCRIFKNISYGALGLTNSKTVYELLDRKIVFNENPYHLCHDAFKKLQNWSIENQYELMDLVRDKHTYLNRIELLFSFFEMVTEHKKE